MARGKWLSAPGVAVKLREHPASSDRGVMEPDVATSLAGVGGATSVILMTVFLTIRVSGG